MVQNNFANPFADMFKMPGLDMSGMMNMQRSNLEAMSSMGQVVAETMQTMAKRQGEMVHSAANQMMNLAKEVSASPEVGLQKVVSFAKNSLEHASSHASELADVAVKSGKEVFEMMSQKLTENMECASSCSAKKRA